MQRRGSIRRGPHWLWEDEIPILDEADDEDVLIGPGVPPEEEEPET